LDFNDVTSSKPLLLLGQMLITQIPSLKFQKLHLTKNRQYKSWYYIPTGKFLKKSV